MLKDWAEPYLPNVQFTYVEVEKLLYTEGMFYLVLFDAFDSGLYLVTLVELIIYIFLVNFTIDMHLQVEC